MLAFVEQAYSCILHKRAGTLMSAVTKSTTGILMFIKRSIRKN